MAARQITADEIAAGDRLNLAGAEFTVTARVHGAWYLDCPRARWVEFELIPTGGLPVAPNGAGRAPAAQRACRRAPNTLVTVDRSAADLSAPATSSVEPASTRNLPATSASLVA